MKKSTCGSQEDFTKLILDSGDWLDKVDESILRQLQNVSKAFHPLYPTIYLPIHHYGIQAASRCCRRRKVASIMVDEEING